MWIEAYFQRLQDLVDACPVVQSAHITYDKRSTHEGFVRGEMYFVDGSVLHLREFVDVETTVERLLYVYQYMATHQQLRFRQVVPSLAPDLTAVLDEIAALVQLPQ